MKYWLLITALLLSSPPVSGEELPFTLPDHWWIGRIPNGQGMSFFYGHWRHDVDITITPGYSTTGPQENNMDYRVLAEAPNYVLILERVSYYHNRAPSHISFSVLTYSSRYSEDWEPDIEYPYMSYFNCSRFKKWKDMKAFDLPKEQIMAIFRNSDCTGINPTGEVGRLGEHWNFTYYAYAEDNPPKGR